MDASEITRPSVPRTAARYCTRSFLHTASTITYTWTAAGQLGAATGRIFAAQFGGSGSVHPGDGGHVARRLLDRGGGPDAAHGDLPVTS